MKGLFSEFEFKKDYRLYIWKILLKSADVIKNQTILKSISTKQTTCYEQRLRLSHHLQRFTARFTDTRLINNSY